VLYDVGNVYATRASHFATLAIQAQLQCLVIIGRVLQAIPLTVGTSLLGTGIVGSHSGNRTHGGADAALGALLKIVVADVAQLHSFSHNIPLKNHQSNRYLVYLKSLLRLGCLD
jgi:hypothetical protein